jgi:two-component system response regulator VicR
MVYSTKSIQSKETHGWGTYEYRKQPLFPQVGETERQPEMKPVLTASDVARYCHVSFSTVRRWIKEEHFPAYMTPSGHYRILPSEFRAFLEQNRLPVDDAFFRKLEPEKRILIVSNERHILELIARALRHYDDRFETVSTSDPLRALVLVDSFRPHLVALDLTIPRVEGFQICEWIRANPDTAHIKILTLTGLAEPEATEPPMPLSVDGYVKSPLNIGELLTKVDRLLSTE